MKKRTFLGILASFFGLSLLVPENRLTTLFNRLAAKPLTDLEFKNAAIIAQCIFPEDTAPGAFSLGIHTFFANKTDESYFRRYLPAIRRLSSWAEKSARQQGKDHFSDFSSEAIQSLLEGISTTNAPLQNDLSSMMDLTLEACFSSPVHGGNTNGVNWRMLGDSFKKEWLDG